MIDLKDTARIKRKLNAASIKLTLTKPDGTEIKMPRKLKMLTIINLHDDLRRKVTIKEIAIF